MTSQSLIALIPLLVSGCVAVGPLTTKTETVTVAEVSGASMCPDLREVGELLYCIPHEAQNFTMQLVLSSWGEPKTRGVKEGREFLTYNSGLAWRGLLIVFVVVPIPLLLPIGYNETTLVFENETLVLTVKDYTESNVAGCGLDSPNGIPKCGVHRTIN